MGQLTPEEGIADVYRRYVTAFNTGDGAKVARVMAYPVMVGGSGHPPGTIPDEAGYQAMIENTFVEFRKLGWVRSQIDRIEAVSTAGDTGVVAAWFSRWREDGSQIEEGNGHYIAVKQDGEWKLTAAIVS
ncbi:MAG: nuclear transport factor 2 family protein [Novosphingobium sp.]|nr:nuclear transport factor 2 family protein [Novosphingobium sp.]